MTALVTHNLPFRSVDTVMDINRLGALYPYPLSFMRCLLRRLMNGHWSIKREKFQLDNQGYGEAIYSVDTGKQLYHFIVFSHHLDDADRSDRVIAEKWDMTATLCRGDLSEARLNKLRQNVPLQEAGRVDTNCMVLTRANKSGRNFNYIVDCLARGQQPDMDVLAKVGYLFRTTAVYGSGKFGMADWEKICWLCPEFQSPFMAEMLVCYLIRQFSLELTDWVATHKGGVCATRLDNNIKRYMGIGNATGLGMAPYLIRHPKLIANWIDIREKALRRVAGYKLTEAKFYEFLTVVLRAIQHLSEIDTDNLEQNSLNRNAREQAFELICWADQGVSYNRPETWPDILIHVASYYDFETQELINSCLLEVYREDIYDLENGFCADEVYDLIVDMTLVELRVLIETHYDWALFENYAGEECLDTFWYRSEEKMEPRLGRRSQEMGAEKEMFLGIGHAVKSCYDAISLEEGNMTVAAFVFHNPEYRYIIRRIQTMSATKYGDIRGNLLHADVRPIQLLRCKLSFFGVGKFDPRSRLWVRNTMFQGAPLMDDIGQDFNDDWCFPVRP